MWGTGFVGGWALLASSFALSMVALSMGCSFDGGSGIGQKDASSDPSDAADASSIDAAPVEPDAGPNALLVEDFESTPDFSGSIGDAQRTRSQARGGRFSARLRGTAGEPSAFYYLDVSNLQRVHVRFFLYIEDTPNSGWITFLQTLSQGGAQFILGDIYNVGTLDVWSGPAVQGSGASSEVVSADAWHRIDIYISGFATDGKEKASVIWLDGVEVGRLNPTLIPDTEINKVELGIVLQSGAPVNEQIYIDDVSLFRELPADLTL